MTATPSSSHKARKRVRKFLRAWAAAETGTDTLSSTAALRRKDLVQLHQDSARATALQRQNVRLHQQVQDLKRALELSERAEASYRQQLDAQTQAAGAANYTAATLELQQEADRAQILSLQQLLLEKDKQIRALQHQQQEQDDTSALQDRLQQIHTLSRQPLLPEVI